MPRNRPLTVEEFRAQTGGRGGGARRRWRRSDAERLTVREKLVMAGVLLPWCWLLWALAGYYWWGLLGGFVAALIGLNTLWAPLPGESSRAENGPSANLRALLRFPPFWIGWVLWFYLFIQVFNLRFELIPVPAGIGHFPREHIAWLPSSINGSLKYGGPFQWLMIFGGPWLMSCCAWVGLRRRLAWQWLFIWVAGWLVVYQGVAFYQHWQHYDAIFRLFPSSWHYFPYFWGTFFQMIHAGYFLGWGATIVGTLGLLGLRRAVRRGILAGPHWLLFGFAALLTLTLLAIPNRGPVLFHALIWLVLGGLMVREVRQVIGLWWTLGLIGGILTLFPALAIKWWLQADTEERFRLDSEIRSTEKLLENWRSEPRVILNQIAWDFWLERPWLGQGTGTWLHFYQIKARDYPNLQRYRRVFEYNPEQGRIWPEDAELNAETGKIEGRRVRISYYYVHNDFMECLYALGVIGCLPLLGLGGFYGWRIWRARRHFDAPLVVAFTGTGGLLLFGLVDYYFLGTPLVHASFVLSLIGGIRWLDDRLEAVRTAAESAEELG